MDNTPPKPAVDTTKPIKFSFEQEASPSALLIVRHDFNPNMITDVARLKLLAAALMTEAERLRDRPLMPETDAAGNPNVPNAARNARLIAAERNAALAITHLEDAAMHLVKAATA
ncbi:MAG: hypothetical protein RLZZ393_584 [Pseudomonadota bacterium]|jgi:hypothetical protein